jgi:phage terminase large subunit
LQLPPKLYPVIDHLDKYRYFLLEGGRGGGKSQAIGRFILYLCETYNIRVVCGREIQNSITESVYSLMVDLIRTHSLQMFEVFSSKIVHKIKGSTINFRGFREQGSFNIQGMEGVDIVWIDEAQAVTKQTLDVLIPTIRKDNAKIFFSMNRHVANDPVYSTFSKRDDCLHIKINFDDNPFCTKSLIKESEECRKISEKDYDHIWLGNPLDMAEDSVYSRSELEYSKTNVYKLRDGYGIRVAGFDIARYGDDKCAVVVLQQMGALHWETILVDEWDHKDLNYTTGRILHTSNQQNVARAIIDEDGLGAGPFDTLTKGRGLDMFTGFRNPVIGYNENKEFANHRTKWAYKLKDMLMNGHIHITEEKLIDELMTIKYTFDNNQRRILISKEKMRKDGFKSPNMADALIMAVSIIGAVKQEQEQPYRPRQSNYSKDENLFNIAGIR